MIWWVRDMKKKHISADSYTQNLLNSENNIKIWSSLISQVSALMTYRFFVTIRNNKTPTAKSNVAAETIATPLQQEKVELVNSSDRPRSLMRPPMFRASIDFFCTSHSYPPSPPTVTAIRWSWSRTVTVVAGVGSHTISCCDKDVTRQPPVEFRNRTATSPAA